MFFLSIWNRMNTEFDYISPTRIIFGKGSIQNCGKLAYEFGNNALVVTLCGNVSIDSLRTLLRSEGIKWTEYRSLITSGNKEAYNFNSSYTNYQGKDAFYGVGNIFSNKQNWDDQYCQLLNF